MVYKDFYHLMLEYFTQPVELFTSAKKSLSLCMLKNKSCLTETGKTILVASNRVKLQRLLSGLKKMKGC